MLPNQNSQPKTHQAHRTTLASYNALNPKIAEKVLNEVNKSRNTTNQTDAFIHNRIKSQLYKSKLLMEQHKKDKKLH
jgi:hypothetical protein